MIDCQYSKVQWSGAFDSGGDQNYQRERAYSNFERDARVRCFMTVARDVRSRGLCAVISTDLPSWVVWATGHLRSLVGGKDDARIAWMLCWEG